MLTSIRAKLGAVFISFLVLITASVAATGISVRTQTHDARGINLAGRQRMLTQKMTKAVLGVAEGSGSEYPAELVETADLFDQALAALLDGGSARYGDETATLPPATDADIRAQLQQVAELWERFRQEVEVVQEAEPGSAIFVAAVREIEALSPVILQEMDAAVRLFEAAAEHKLIHLHGIQGLFFASAIGLLIGGYVLTQRTIVRPVTALEAATRQIAAGDLETPVEIQGSGEVRVLAQQMEDMRHRLLTSRRELEHSATDLRDNHQKLTQAYHELQEAHAGLLEKERLEHELDLARKLQQSILPQEFPELPGFHFAARSRAARQVGGDFYDVIPLGDGRVGLVMADVSDKGMAAALYMALTRSLVHAEAKRSSSPRQVLLSVHRLLLEMSQADMFVTVFYGVLDPAQGTLRYARAGHDRPLLYSPNNGGCRFLAARGMLLGLWEEVTLEEAQVDLHPGDLLVLYSDGITDASSRDGEFFGGERLCETVSGADERRSATAGGVLLPARQGGRRGEGEGAGLSAQEMCQLIFESVDRFQVGAVQHDDMALMVVKADGRAGEEGSRLRVESR